MNRPLPAGDRRHPDGDPRGESRSGRALSGPAGLVGGTAAAARQPRSGHCCATFGQRASGRRRLGMKTLSSALSWSTERNPMTNSGVVLV